MRGIACEPGPRLVERATQDVVEAPRVARITTGPGVGPAVTWLLATPCAFVTDVGVSNVAEPDMTCQLMVTPGCAIACTPPLRVTSGRMMTGGDPATTVIGSGKGVFGGVDWPSPLPIASSGSIAVTTLMVNW